MHKINVEIPNTIPRMPVETTQKALSSAGDMTLKYFKFEHRVHMGA